jgi:hypothetical protein
VTGRTQYGQLVHRAGEQILSANVALETAGFDDVAAAKQAVVAYRDLLHALGRHGSQLLGSDDRLRGIRASVNADPRDVAAAQLVDYLAHVGQRDLGGSRRRGVAAAWRSAAASVRAGTDLLATYRGHEGRWLTPEAAVLDDAAVRAAGFGELASLSLPVATAANSLGRRMSEVGFAVRDVHELVPETGPLRWAASEARRLANLGGLGAPLSRLEVARPSVRSDNPVLELGDRLARLHRVAWQLTREERVGACTLADFSVAGVVINEYAARVIRQVAAAGPASTPDLSARRALARFEQGGACWRLVHLHVRQLRTPTPAMLGLRADVVAVRQLLNRLVGEVGVPTREVQSAVIGGARRFGDVAAWSLQVLDEQGRRGQLFVPGRFLTGNQVSDDLVLVEAKLKGKLAPALKEHIEPLRAAYDAARLASSDRSSGPDEPPSYAMDHGCMTIQT